MGFAQTNLTDRICLVVSVNQSPFTEHAFDAASKKTFILYVSWCWLTKFLFITKLFGLFLKVFSDHGMLTKSSCWLCLCSLGQCRYTFPLINLIKPRLNDWNLIMASLNKLLFGFWRCLKIEHSVFVDVHCITNLRL